MSNTDRRGFIRGVAATAAVTATSASSSAPRSVSEVVLPETVTTPGSVLATQTDYWRAVKALYDVDPGIVNLENGYWGIMAEPVRREYVDRTDRINRENSVYARTRFASDMEPVRAALAAALGCSADEIALTRGATEALQMLISGYNRLRRGDAVMYADLDYDSMQYTMNWLKDRRGVEVIRFAIPEPASRAAVLDAYRQQFEKNPHTRLVLLTHVSHRTGLVIPVAEISTMARARGIDVIVDAAHSWGQIDFRVADLGTDFIGFNLHKWIGAPLGVGFMYIKRNRIADIDRAMGDEDYPAGDIRGRVHTGTFNFAAFLTVQSALALHQRIGAAAKAARLRYLRDYWVARARGLQGLEILTPDEPGMYAGITSFRFAGKLTAADNNFAVAKLIDQHGVFAVRRGGVAKGHCIRISPAIYTTEADLDRLLAGLKALSNA